MCEKRLFIDMISVLKVQSKDLHDVVKSIKKFSST